MRCCVIWISRCEKDHTGKSVTLSWSIQMFGVQNSSVHHHFLKTLLFINISTGKVNYLNQFPLHPILVLFYIFLKTSWFKLQLLTAEGQITKQNPSEFVVASLSLLKTSEWICHRSRKHLVPHEQTNKELVTREIWLVIALECLNRSQK